MRGGNVALRWLMFSNLEKELQRTKGGTSDGSYTCGYVAQKHDVSQLEGLGL